MSKRINLVDLFNNDCRYYGCIHNEEGICINYRHVSDFMDYTEGEEYASCHVEGVKEGYCPKCLGKMYKFIERLPHGSDTVELVHYECTQC